MTLSETEIEGFSFVTGLGQDATLAATGSLTLPAPSDGEELMLILLPTSVLGTPVLTTFQINVTGASNVDIVFTEPGVGRTTLGSAEVCKSSVYRASQNPRFLLRSQISKCSNLQ